MRLRPLALLSTVAVAGLLLSGCAGQPEGKPTTPASDDKDVCSTAAEPGDVSESVKVEGDFGTASTATFDLEQKIDEVQRSVVIEGDGEKIDQNDYVDYALSAFSSTTGERLGDAGYTEGELLPQKVLSDANLAQVIGCVSTGSRLAVALPGDQQGDAAIYVIDVQGVVPTAAWGTAKPASEGMPKVTLADDGEPDVAVPNAEAPGELKIAVLKEGDGPAVADGDTTLLQYYGVDWESGESFDSSWSKGEPLALPGNTYVPGFVQALAGQKVGSQVLVVIPPALAYGDDPKGHELGGKTLVFVIDILATQHAPAQ